MKHLLTLLLLLAAPLLTTPDLLAQRLQRVTPVQPEHVHSAEAPARATTARASDGEPIPHSGTHRLMQHPEHRAALQRYHAQRPLDPGASLRAESATYQLGQRKTFEVWNFQQQEYETVDFTLEATTDRFYLWVQTGELAPGRVRAQDIDSLKRALYDATPAGSVNPDQGIIVNDEEIFGAPPDVDGDGRTDVLLVDIQDSYDPPDNLGFTAGFVTASDLTGSGNNRDILYLDTMPGIYSGSGDSLTYRHYNGIASTAAHEYQHLIRFAYDANELTFVDEGLSEYAEVLNGYPLRAPQYLSDVETYNVSLLSWSDEANERLFDYQRAGLFTLYLGNRIGYEAAGRLTRLNSVGYFTYKSVLDEAGVAFEDLMLNFHTANFLNDASVGEPFGYPRFDGRFSAAPSIEVDGRTAMKTDVASVPLKPGGVQYLSWTDVRDFTLLLDATTKDRRAWLRARVLLYSDAGVEVRDLTLQPQPQLFEGDFDRVVVVMAHANANKSTAHVRYSAQWNVDVLYAINDVSYDDGSIATDDGGGLMYLLLGEEELLTRFEQPENASLARIRLPLYFFSQFGNDDAPPETAPRDFTLVIRDVAEDGGPGEELYRQVLDDPQPYQPLTNDIATTVQFTALDVADLPMPLPQLPETFFIGYTNAGSDENEIVFAPSPSTSNVSYIGPTSQGSFRALWDVTLTDETSLEGTVIPIRAEFLTPQGPPELPEAVTLVGFPNPNAGNYTTIEYALPKEMHVRLSVYDLLGRQIAVLFDGVPSTVPPPPVIFDVSQLAAGVYFYVLETEQGTTTEKMVVL